MFVNELFERSHTNLRSEVWLTGVEYNEAEDAWNIFYVAYRGGDPDKWYAFYGGHYHIPRGPWSVGMAVAPRLSGPWKRIPEGHNPVPIVSKIVIRSKA